SVTSGPDHTSRGAGAPNSAPRHMATATNKTAIRSRIIEVERILAAASESGRLISFDTMAVSTSVLANLRASPAKWEAISVMEDRPTEDTAVKKLRERAKAAGV